MTPPISRRAVLGLGAALGLAPAAPVRAHAADFPAWLRGYRDRALRMGLPRGIVDAGLSGARFLPDVIRLDRSQFEFTKTIWDYLDTAVSADRIRTGQRMVQRHDRLLRRIEARYAVDRHVVVAIWGLESSYGRFMGTTDVVSALATLAHDGRRGAFFEDQLSALLRIAASNEVWLPVQGSWAGAMGHTQFIPTSYEAHAVDFDGDGRRNIWGSDPADALASAAAYLAGHGWQHRRPWGIEVRLPQGFDYRLARRDERRMPSDWAALGVRGAGGGIVPNHGLASVLLPAGAQGVAFLVFDNFGVIERYNTADAYVIAVGHLADRLRGAGGFRASWPRRDRALTYAERRELQRRLAAEGLYTGPVDGRMGPLTTQAIRRAQAARGLVPDGYASLAILSRLRR